MKQLVKDNSIRTIPKDKLYDFMISEITKLFALCNICPDINDKKYVISETIDYVIIYYGYYTFDDIRECFRLGIDEEFGKTYDINVKTIRVWLKKYNELLLQDYYNKNLNKKTNDDVSSPIASRGTSIILMWLKNKIDKNDNNNK